MGIPWDGMGWDRHNLLWDGMGWDRKICPMDKPGDLTKILLVKTTKQGKVPQSAFFKDTTDWRE